MPTATNLETREVGAGEGGHKQPRLKRVRSIRLYPADGIKPSGCYDHSSLHKRPRTLLEGRPACIETEEIRSSGSEPDEEEEDWLAALSSDSEYSHVEGSPIANMSRGEAWLGGEVAEPVEIVELDLELNAFMQAEDILDW